MKVGNKLPLLLLRKPLCMGDLLPVRKIFIERPDGGGGAFQNLIGGLSQYMGEAFGGGTKMVFLKSG